jgi:hypothetical protein
VNLRSVAEHAALAIDQGSTVVKQSSGKLIGSKSGLRIDQRHRKARLRTDRHRTVRSKRCLSNKTALAMIFKRAEAAKRNGV